KQGIIDPMEDTKRSFENIDFPTNLSGNENLNGVYAIIGPFLIQKYLTYKTIAFFLELITLFCCIKRQLSPSQRNFQEIVSKILISVCCLVSQSHASRKIATKRSKSTCIIYRWGCLYGKLSLEGVKTSIQWCVYVDEFLTQKVLKIKKNMKKSSKAIMIGIVIWLAAIEIVLIYIACTIQTNKDITFEDQNVQRNNTTVPTTTSSMTVPTTISTTLRSTTTSKNFTEKTTTSQTDRTPVFTGNTSLTTKSSVATTKIMIPPPTPIPPPIWTPTPTPNLTSKTTSTTDGIITVPSTQSTTISMRSTTMPMQSTTQCVLNITYPSSTTASPSIFTDSNTNVTDPSTTEENIPKITPIFNYILRDDTGVACVLANMTIHILESMLTVPTDATTTGICVGKTANMTLSWEEPVKSYNNKKTKITFNYFHDNNKFFLDSIFVDLHEKRMIGNATARHRLFSAAIKDGIFICETSTIINVENKINIDISDIYLIVFNECFNNCRKTVQLKDELKGFNRGGKNSFAKSVFFLARRDMSFLFLLRPWKYENLVKSNNKNILEYTYMKNSRKDKSHSEVLERDNLLHVKSAASCASSCDVLYLRRGWNFKIFRASATQRQLFAHIPFILPASMYRWLLNTRSIVQLLSLVLPLPT
ncbi:ZAN protein, partial [Pseudoatta argentina]